MRTFAFAVVACLFVNGVAFAGSEPQPTPAQTPTSVEKDVDTTAPTKDCTSCDCKTCVTLFPRRSVSRSYSQGECGECTTTRTITRYYRPRLFGRWRSCRSSCSSCSSCN